MTEKGFIGLLFALSALWIAVVSGIIVLVD